MHARTQSGQKLTSSNRGSISPAGPHSSIKSSPYAALACIGEVVHTHTHTQRLEGYYLMARGQCSRGLSTHKHTHRLEGYYMYLMARGQCSRGLACHCSLEELSYHTVHLILHTTHTHTSHTHTHSACSPEHCSRRWWGTGSQTRE